MSIKWRIFCLTDETLYEWNETAPVVCPNNSEHTLVSVVAFAVEQEVFRVNYSSTITSSNYQRICMFQYDTNKFGTLRRFKMLAYCDGNTTNFNIKIVDATNQTILTTFNSTNTNDITVLNLGVVSSSPSGIAILEVQIQRVDGTGSVYFNELTAYSISGTGNLV